MQSIFQSHLATRDPIGGYVFMRILLIIVCVQLTTSCYSYRSQSQPEDAASTSNAHDWTSQRLMHGYRFMDKGKVQPNVLVGSKINGKTIYTKSCAPCHGQTGKGDGKQGQSMSVKPANLSKHPPWHQSQHFFILISVGTKSGMPGWQDMLSEQQIADVIAYIQTF